MREDHVFQEQPTGAECGRGKRSKRSKAWGRDHDAIYAWRSDFIQQQQALINDRKWAAASKEYIDSLYMICNHLMMATEVWLQKLWLELICNYGTDDPKRMAAEMMQAMTDNNSSVLYRVQSIHVTHIMKAKSQLLNLENTRIKSDQQCLNHNPKRK